LETDLKNLKRKVDAGADIIITQLFFDNRHFFDFVKRARAIGITVPIIPGIMPVLNVKQIEKITRMSGAELPKEFYQELLKHQDDPHTVRELGIRHAIKQCRELIALGSSGIHFYTLNRAYSTRKVIEGVEEAHKNRSC
ncbi:MAG: methylenetetrahydrofolate reductase, partial [Deltaproteobacteria bacterium]|nr:methylenetetrahydrofolate reductase [Deltaproteobacteria bacterium]